MQVAVRWLLLALLSGTGPAAAAQKRPAPRGARIAAGAAKWVGVASLREVDRSVSDDCTGLVRLAYREVGIELEGSSATMFRRARRAGAVHRLKPRPGDLVFFRETYDRNGDGRRNDGVTHVAVVESVDRDGTVTFIHRGSRGVARGKMNLRWPKARERAGEVVNDYVRTRYGKWRPRLSGEQFGGYASAKRLAASAGRGSRRDATPRHPAPGHSG